MAGRAEMRSVSSMSKDMSEHQQDSLDKSGMLQLHIAVLLFGAAGLFGKAVALPALLIVLGRVGFAALALFIGLIIFRKDLRLAARRDYGGMFVLGAILAFHWFAFFYSIQLSSVAIGLLTFTTFPVFTMLLERLICKTPISAKSVVAACACIAGVLLIIPAEQWSGSNADEAPQLWGVFWGIASGFSFAVLALRNRIYVQRYDVLLVTFYQCTVAALLLSPAVFFVVAEVTAGQLLYLAALGIVFTALAHGLFLRSMQCLPLSVVSVSTMLEPVYGIVLAFALLGEQLVLRELCGAALILSSVIFISYRRKSKSKSKTKAD